ncbi:hypothetical protein DFQ28_005116 [Apophysomyces sp. BC1034]|nr:hypothetical protein DFQ28_005116 [Apophysomyces sp. BC1034]
MQFGKKARVRYILTAIHDRPLVPESLCSKTEFPVPILEYIDIELPQFARAQEKGSDVLLANARFDQVCHVRISIPRLGFTRGEIIPITIVVNHFEPFVLGKAILVQLVRTVEIRTNKHVLLKEDILRTVEHDINVIGPYNFSQSLKCQHLIPTSTPPSIRYKDKMLRIRYRVRIRVRLSKNKGDTGDYTIEMPIVIGTWPRAAIPIDDYDDEEVLMSMGELMLDDDIREGNFGSDSDSEVQSNLSIPLQRSGQVNGSDFSTSMPSSASTITTVRRAPDKNRVDRSDSTASKSSNRSHGSASSCPSSQTWDNVSSLTQSTSMSTNLSSPEQYQGPYMRGNSMSGNMQSINMNYYPTERSDHPNRAVDPSVIGSIHRVPHHDYIQDNHSSMISMNGYRHSMNVYSAAGPSTTSRQQSVPPAIMNYPPPSYYQPVRVAHDDPRYYNGSSPPPPYQPARSGSDEFRRQLFPTQPPPPMSSSCTDDEVPTHVLQPLSAQLPSPPPTDTFQTYDHHVGQAINNGMVSPVSATFPRKNNNYTYYNNAIQEPSMGSESSDDSDENDLLGIIEKKKKRRERWQ